jgi:hypothetical protein
MMNRYFILIFLTIFAANTMKAERFLYVDDFKNILDNPTRRTALLTYAQSHQISELILYELHLVNAVHNLNNAATNQILADFIKSAKANYGVLRVSAAGETATWFQNNIMTYNATRSLATEKFDGLGLEFEFWTPSAVTNYYCADYLQPLSLPCDSAGAFVFCKNQLTQMKALTAASSHPMSVEMYVGWANAGQLQAMSSIVDRMFIHAYVTNPSSSFTYALTRLNFYSTYNGVANVYIIFSSEPNFMQPWLTTHSMVEAENIFTTAYNAASGAWKTHVNFAGFVYFAYTFQTGIILPISWLKATGKRVAKDVKIDWIIDGSTDLQGFEIERSLDGKLWQSIAKLKENERQFVDNEGITKVIYYRIKALILRGPFELSPIISIDASASKNESNQSISVFPNPFFDEINLPNLPIEAAILVNNQGQNLPVSIVNQRIENVQDLPEGVYYLRLLVAGNWLNWALTKR